MYKAPSKPGDPRMGDIITNSSSSLESGEGEGDVVIVGFPFDEGVRRNGGRLGAKGGPEAVRKKINVMGTVLNPEYGIDLGRIKISDSGDAANQEEAAKQGEGEKSDWLLAAHQKLTRHLLPIIQRGHIPFVIGGGNDQSYPNACALLEAKGGAGTTYAVINIDAHLDVRPLIDDSIRHSGSPFRLLLEDERFEGGHFVEFAAQGSQCSEEHVEYLSGKGGHVIWLNTLRGEGAAGRRFESLLHSLCASGVDHIFVSFDLDAVKGSDAPGVSCASSLGLSAQDAIDICLVAGKHPKVELFDLSEFSPEIEEYRTAKLVADMFYYFAMGVCMRLSAQRK